MEDDPFNIRSYVDVNKTSMKIMSIMTENDQNVTNIYFFFNCLIFPSKNFHFFFIIGLYNQSEE